MGKEKRKYQRLVITRPARCAFTETSLEHFPVMVLDISAEGIGFNIDQKLDAGTNVYLDIDLGNGERVKLAAKVMWAERIGDSGHFRTGAKIFDAQKEDLEKFARFYCGLLFPAGRARKKILIIEDEKPMSDLLKIELTQSGYDVVCAFDGETGFSKYVTERPDLIILDIMLPGLNGYEVCRKIRREKEDNDTPILMLTAKSGDTDRIIGSVIGAQKYITKPFDAEHLLSEIKGILDHKET